MLVEALISIAIFSVGFLAVAMLVLSVSRNNTSGNQLTEANMLARERLEQLKNTSDITLLPSDLTTFSDGPMDGNGNLERLAWRTIGIGIRLADWMRRGQQGCFHDL